MARHIPEESLRAIEEVVRQRPEGMTSPEIEVALDVPLPRRTLQYRLKTLVDDGRLLREGRGRWVRYRATNLAPGPVQVTTRSPSSGTQATAWIQLSAAGQNIRNHVRQPLGTRQPVGYDRSFLEEYRPNETWYLSQAQRSELREIGETETAQQPAGTHARKVLNRLLIDLSWNSSRLEGNTYSLLETERLIERGEHARGRELRETQMILNHKDAISFLVDSPRDIGFNRQTILNLHAILADNLLADPGAPGRLRYAAVGIQGSVFHPLELPQLIEECFDRLLEKARRIVDPFEQAFFVLVHLPYLQSFDDVNKRVSRLAANIPFIKANLSPLSFEEVPRDLYTEAILGVYELKRTELLRDLFQWAYRRSASHYTAMRQSLGEPDPFRLTHRTAIHDLVADIIRRRMDKGAAATHISAWAADHVREAERERFRDVVERQLMSVHEGNFSRYRVRPSEFVAWQEAWQSCSDALFNRQ